MSLFIRNMNMPRINRLYKCELDVRPSGTVLKVNNPITGKEERYVVQEIATPHGRLIDVNKLKSIIGLMTSHPCGCQLETVKDVLWLLDGKVEGEYVVPTIVEAEE